MSAPPAFQASRADVRSKRPWAQFSYVARRLDALVAGLVGNAALGPCPSVLDFGCADQPYRAVFPADAEYVGVDLAGNPLARLVLNPDGTVPHGPDSFDVVLSTQVLEHVADPRQYLAECHRLLKPGGTLVLTTHGIMYYHRDPEDYWRWTRDGLAMVIAESGLVVAEMRGVLGLAATSLQLLQDATARAVPRVVRRVYVTLLQGLIALADRRSSDEGRVDNGMVLGVRAVKPG